MSRSRHSRSRRFSSSTFTPFPASLSCVALLDPIDTARTAVTGRGVLCPGLAHGHWSIAHEAVAVEGERGLGAMVQDEG